MQEEAQAPVVPLVGLRERERLPHQAAHPRTQDVVEALDMTGLPFALASRPVLLWGQHLGIGRPEVGEQQALLVTCRDVAQSLRQVLRPRPPMA